MAEVSERRVRPIQEAVSNQQWKQALQLCEKWHKKGEKSDRFLAIRAIVLANQPDQASILQGRDELVQLCERKPAIKDPDIIHQVGAALQDLKIDHGGKASLWERAALDNLGSKELAGYWVDAAIEQGDWKSAQKATMALRKVSPTDRNYEFWTILMNFMMSRDERTPEKERTMFRTLAYRMLGRAVEAVPTGNQGLSSGKAILSPEELYLLVRVYIDSGQAQAAQTLLTDHQGLGPGSTIDQLDHDLHSSLLVDVLEATRGWPQLVLRLKDSLTNGPITDPHIDRVFKILLDVSEDTENQSFVPDLRSYLDAALEASPDSQTLAHASMRLAEIESRSEKGPHPKLLKACQKYFSLRSTKVSGFDELSSIAKKLSPPATKQFVDFICANGECRDSPTGADSITNLLNCFRLEYCLSISQDDSLATGLNFVARVMDVYSKKQSLLPQKSNLGSQFLLLASMITLKLARDGTSSIGKENDPSTGYLLSCFLLRYIGDVGVDYLVPTLLCRLYALLGALTLSSQSFQSLSIKNLQFDNTGHLFLTRISTIYTPELDAVDEVPDPCDVLDQAVAANKRSLSAVQKHVMGGLECKSYINVMEAVELRGRLKSSISQKLYRLEKARIDRLAGRFASDEFSFYPGPSYDARDYKFIPSFEYSDSKPFSERLETGPRPKGKWVRIMKACHDIANLLHRDKHEPHSITQTELTDLRTSLTDLQRLLSPPDLASDELTAAEISNCVLQVHLGQSWLACRAASLESAIPNSPAPITNIETWLLSTSAAFTTLPTPSPGPAWTYLHQAYSALDSLIIISLFLNCTAPPTSRKSKVKPASRPSTTTASATIPLPKDQHDKITALVVDTTQAIRSSARKALAAVEKVDNVDRMMDEIFGAGKEEGLEEWGELGRVVERLDGAREVAEGMCLDLKESWGVGLRGVLGVKVGSL